MTQRPDIVRGRAAMLAGMTPALRDGRYVFCTTDSPTLVAALAGHSLALVREDEGTTLVLAEADAERHGFAVTMPMALIVLEVYSALDGVGLTAAVATALADRGIPCNIIAAYHHDHVFVPAHRAHDALRILEEAQSRAAGTIA